MKRVGLELSPDRVAVWVRGEGLVLDEPAVVSSRDQRPTGLGRMVLGGRGPREGAEGPIWPIGMSRLADPAAAAQLMRQVLLRTVGKLPFTRHELMLAVPAGLDTAGRRVLLEVALSHGSRMAHMMDLPLAAALGMGRPVASWRPTLVLLLQRSGAEAAVVCHDGLLGWRVAERTPPEQESPPESWEAKEEMERLVGMLSELLAELPAEVRSEVSRTGLHLAGTEARWEVLAGRLAANLGLPVRAAADPQGCVPKGIGLAMDRLEALGSQGLLYLR